MKTFIERKDKHIFLHNVCIDIFRIPLGCLSHNNDGELYQTAFDKLVEIINTLDDNSIEAVKKGMVN